VAAWDWLTAPGPAVRLALLRVLVGGYLTLWSLARLPAHLGHADQAAVRWRPVGVLAGLSVPPPDAAVVALAVVTPVLALLFTLGWRFALVAPACALATLAVTTLDSAWGQVFHTENLLVLHVGILAAAPAADVLRVGRLPRRRPVARDGGDGRDARYGWPVRVAAVVVVLAYVLAGVAKLRVSGLAWVDGEVLRNLVAHDNLRKALLGDTYSPIGTWLVRHGWAFAPLALASLAVELGAPLALTGGRRRTAWVAAAWLFHVGVLALMAISFPYQLTGVAFAPFLPLERLGRGVAARLPGRRADRVPGRGTHPDELLARPPTDR
jgi:hypothetical protein